MKLNSLTAVLYCDDVRASITFYETLGFDNVSFDEEVGWARMVCGDTD